MKNSKPVAVERRYDLASLFCMIGRHGPVVAMAVIATLSVMAAFVIYRTVRGKRRKATAAANSGNTLAAERDAAVSKPGQEPSQEETHSSADSTEESDEGSPDLLEEDPDQIQGNLEIGECCTAAVEDSRAEKKPRLCSAPEPYHAQGLMYQVPDCQPAHQDALEETAVASQRPERDVNTCNAPETFAEEVNQCHREPEMEAEDVECARGNTEDESIEDVVEEDHDNHSCLKEPELIDYESCQEEELDQACEAEYQEAAASVCPDEDMTTELCVPCMETRQEEEDFQCAVNELLSQTPHIHDDKTTQEREDKDEDSIEKLLLLPEEEKKDEGEEEEECVDYQLIAQQPEIWAKTAEEEMNLPFSQLPSVYQQSLNEQHDQREHVMDKMTLFTWGGFEDDDDGGLACQVIEKDGDEDIDYLNDLSAVTHGPHLSWLSEQQVEQKDENHCTFHQEDGVLPSVADQLKEKTVASDDVAARVISEDRDDSSVVLSPVLPSFTQPGEQEKHDNGHDGSPDVVTEAEGWISSIVYCPPLSSCLQSEQKEDKDETAPSLDEDNVPMHDPHLPSCDRDQQSDHVVNKAYMAADPDMVACDGENIRPGSHLLSSYQEQQSEKMSNNDALSMDHTTADGDGVPASILDEDISPPRYHPQLSLFDENEQRVSDDDSKSSPGVEESGISSMTLSSDLYSTPLCKDADDEYDVSTPFTDEESDLSVMDVGPYLPSCHQPQRLGPMETHHSQYADDDVSKPVIDEDGSIACMVFGPYPTPLYQQPHREFTGEAIGEPFGGNDDVLGQVIEDRYNREIDQFSEQITSLTDELNKQTEVKEKKEGGNVDKKEGTQSEEDKGEDYEKTEISIMEATMDNNEWMTDGTYQVLPWMSFPLPSFAQNHTRTDQLPAEEHQRDSTITTAVTDAASMDATAVNITTSTEDKQTSVLSLADENTENSKKVVAVQPMPQNVNVTFCVHYLTHFPGQTVAVTGNQQELGSWKGFIPLERAKDGYWASVISLPAESQVEWKFVLVEEGEICRWEECDNRFLDTGYGDDLHVHKWWGFL